MPEQTNGAFRLVTIDGGGMGQVVCTNSTGDLPVFMIVIDPAQCVAPTFENPAPAVPPSTFMPPPPDPGVPVIEVPPLVPVTPPIPEPEVWALLLVGLAFAAWRKRRARRDKLTWMELQW